jgi:hypothetical protein
MEALHLLASEVVGVESLSTTAKKRIRVNSSRSSSGVRRGLHSSK